MTGADSDPISGTGRPTIRAAVGVGTAGTPLSPVANARLQRVVVDNDLHLAEVNQTDWEFLQGRAAEIGYETGVADAQFYFRPAGAGGAGISGVVQSVVSGAVATAASVPVSFPDTLISFRPRITAGNITP